jgi:hypothetical protein
MVNRRRGVLIVGLAVVAAVASIVLADVIFVYEGTIYAYNIRSPLIFDSGPNAPPVSSAAAPYVSFSQTSTGTGFIVKLAITNASAIYYYEVGQLTVTANGFLYVNSISYTGSAGINILYIYIVPISGGPGCTITLIK